MPSQQESSFREAVVTRLFSVADYQRPYAWSDKQLADLWEDIDLIGPGRHHYFGTLVLQARRADGAVETSVDDDGATLEHYDVVDGQQRLTTCLLLLDRVRRRLGELDDPAAGALSDELRRTYGFVVIDRASMPRLRLGRELNDYWVNSLLGDESPAGSSTSAGVDRLRNAAEFLDRRIDELCEAPGSSAAIDRLRELQRRLSDGLRVLIYEVASAAEVGVIFETLNERGKPLTELEKTKNYLLYLARQIPDGRSKQLAEFINDRWSKIFTALSRPGAEVDDDQLLRVHWLATQNPDSRAWRGVASIKDQFDRSEYTAGNERIVPPLESDSGSDPHGELDQQVRQYVMTLQHTAEHLSEMFDPHGSFTAFGEHAEAVRKASAALQRSRVVAPYRPLLCAARLRHPTDGEFYCGLLRLLECYSARVFVISQKRSNAGSQRLNRIAFDLHSGRIDQAEVLTSVRMLIWRYAGDEHVRKILLDETENWYVRQGHKYFLFEYERSQMGAGPKDLEFAVFTEAGSVERTTEHILPQTPDPDDRCWWDAFSVEEHVALRHSLGNLVLTLDNSSYGRKCFVQKRGAAVAAGVEKSACYAQSTLHQERELALYESWTPESIRERQAKLAEWALKQWHIDPPSAEQLEPAEAEPEIEDDGDEADGPER